MVVMLIIEGVLRDTDAAEARRCVWRRVVASIFAVVVVWFGAAGVVVEKGFRSWTRRLNIPVNGQSHGDKL